MYNQINFNHQPAFGMAFRFQKGGAKRMAEAFIDAPDEARNLIKSQLKNKDVETIVTAKDIHIEPKMHNAQAQPLIDSEILRNLKTKINRMPVFRHIQDTDISTDPTILNLREDFRDAAKLSDKMQAEINKLKGENMSISDFTKELEDLAKQ